MTGASLERLLRRDRAIVLAAIAAVVLLAAAWLVSFGARAAGTAMTGMAMDAAHGAALSPGFAPWSEGDFLIMLTMWAAMMIGMMTPSVAPMLLIYARVARHAEARAQPFAPVGWFASGYLLAWTLFSLLATSLQWLLERAALMTPAMSIADDRLAGALLVAAGLYQWTPVKEACLGRCRSPFQFIQAHGGFRPERRASLLLGLKHGTYCIGCCWALMLLLFFGGVMNLLWIAALAAFVLAEKLVPQGRLLSRAAGAALIAAGAALIV
jgi:predicted metal-binding membrane protein